MRLPESSSISRMKEGSAASYFSSSSCSSTEACSSAISPSCPRVRSPGSPSRWKFSRISRWQKAWMVQISALPSSSDWRRSAAFSGSSSILSERRPAMRWRISSAAALEKVTMSSRSRSTGAVRSEMRVSTRSVKTAVFPLPAAAETSRSPPRAVIACRCGPVHLRSLILLPPFLRSLYAGPPGRYCCTGPYRGSTGRDRYGHPAPDRGLPFPAAGRCPSR